MFLEFGYNFGNAAIVFQVNYGDFTSLETVIAGLLFDIFDK